MEGVQLEKIKMRIFRTPFIISKSDKAETDLCWKVADL